MADRLVKRKVKATATIRDLARCERSRVSRRGALATLVGGLLIAGVGVQLARERDDLYERQRRRRPYAAARGRSPTRSGSENTTAGPDARFRWL